MKNTRSALCGQFSGLLVLAVSVSSAHASVMIELSGTPGSSVINYNMTGTGLFTGNDTSALILFPDVLFNAFDFALEGNPEFTISGTGTFTNTTTAVSRTLQSVVLDWDTDGAGPNRDDVFLRFDAALPSSSGDAYLMSGSGTFDMGGTATFDDLNVGSGNFAVGFNAIDQSTLSITTAVPEASEALVVLLGMTGLLGARRRRR